MQLFVGRRGIQHGGRELVGRIGHELGGARHLERIARERERHLERASDDRHGELVLAHVERRELYDKHALVGQYLAR